MTDGKPGPELQRDSIEYFVNQIITHIYDSDGNEFNFAVDAFMRMAQSRFNKAKQENNESVFLSALFQSVQLQVDKAHEYIIVMRAITRLKLGDKIAIANRITAQLAKLPPDPNPLIWDNIGEILIWLSRSLKDSMQLVLFTLRQFGLQWPANGDADTNIAGFRLLSVIMRHFPESMISAYSHIQGLITLGMQQPDERIAMSAVDLTKVILSNKTVRQQFNIEQLFRKILLVLNPDKYMCFGPLASVLSTIYEIDPRYSRFFAIQMSPLDMLKKKTADLAPKRAALTIIPVVVKMSGQEQVIVDLLKCLQDMVKKRVLVSEVLICVGQIIFNRRLVFTQAEAERLRKIKKAVRKDGVEQEALSLFSLALLALQGAQATNNDINDVFSKFQITPLTISGIHEYLRLIPEKALPISRVLLNKLSSVLCDANAPKAKIIFALQTLTKLNVMTSYISVPLALRISAHMGSKDFETRQVAGEFMLMYQRENPCIEVLIRILTVIATELNQNQRIYWMTNLNKVPSDESVLIVLRPLLHDTCIEIQHDALRYLTSLYAMKGVQDILRELLTEKAAEMEYSAKLSKDNIECFLIISNDAFGGQKVQPLVDLLKPFADFLIKLIVETDSLHLSIITLQLLSHLLKMKSSTSIDIEKLVQHIDNALLPHASCRRLNAAIDLLISALENTSLKYTIYTEHPRIIFKLHQIAKLGKTHVNRQYLLHALSIIGAVKPHRIQKLSKKIMKADDVKIINTPMSILALSDTVDTKEAMLGTSSGIAISTLLDIMSDNTLLPLFTPAMDALLKILRRNRQIGKVLEDEILRKMGDFMTIADDNILSNIISHFATFIGTFGEKFGPLVPKVVDFICLKWDSGDEIKGNLLRITEWMNNTVQDLLEPHILRIANKVVSNISQYSLDLADNIFLWFVSLGCHIKITGRVVYPAILEWVNNHATDTVRCSQALEKLADLMKKGASEPFTSQIVRTMVHIVSVNRDLHDKALGIVYLVALIIEIPFLMYMPLVQRVFDLDNNDWMIMMSFYMRGDPLPKRLRDSRLGMGSTKDASKRAVSVLKPKAGIDNTTHVAHNIDLPNPEWTETQWEIWWEKLNAELLQHSESRAISVCKELASRHSLIKNTFFPVAFVLMYVFSVTQSDLDAIISVVFMSNQCPSYIIRGFLSVLELFEVLQIKRPLNNKVTAQKAVDVDLFAQALRLYEQVFLETRDEESMQALISLNQQLGQPHAANGILQLSESSTSQAVLAEKLGLWEDAFEAYSNNTPQNVDGIMNCLRALSRFDELKQVAKSGHFRASAHWHLFEYKEFVTVAQALQDTEQNRYFILLCKVMKLKFDEAEHLIERMRDDMKDKMFPIIGEDYERAYRDFASISYLAEVEEVIKYKRSEDVARSAFAFGKEAALQTMKQIKDLWRIRFMQLDPLPDVLHGHLCIRSMVLPISEQRESFMMLLKSTLEHHKLELAESVVNMCLSQDPCEDYEVMKTKLMWAKGCKEEALHELTRYADTDSNKLILAKWLNELGRESEAYAYLEPLLTSDLKDSPEVWDTWSQTNMNLFNSTKNPENLVAALHAVMNALRMANKNHLAYTLRILGIVFQTDHNNVFSTFLEHIDELPIHVWIEVLPQILSRLSSPHEIVRAGVRELTIRVGLAHPNAVLFPLMVPLALNDATRQMCAREILEQIQKVHPQLVNSVMTFSSEIARISVTWWETLVAEIDEASRAHVNRHNIDEMLEIMARVNKLSTVEPVSFYETSFVRAAGENLKLAEELWHRYNEKRDSVSFNALWCYYTRVFYHMKAIVEKMSIIELRDASPYLYGLKDSLMSVPGTYTAGGELVNIKSLCNELIIISSKQRPRKMSMYGSDGIKYSFLLKAHEDTRLDERVMQLFSFINALVDASNLPLRSRLGITTYKVIPITGEVGLIGWVPGCCTLFDILSAYRKKRGISVKCEYEFVMKNCPDYDRLPIQEKVCAFKSGFSRCRGDDLKVTMFNNSMNSADWLERRTNYTASLAMTSMAGYILGLGDRHTCNLMMKTKTAKIVHIDFGDSFEVAQHRDLFPEKVPFRLTRLLVKALEVAGIKGTFKSACTNVMSLLRKNADQITGLISVFNYDPLKQWAPLSENTGSSVSRSITSRIADKLNGNDIEKETNLTAEQQVDRLIAQATDEENLCCMFRGWYPWW